MASSFYEYSAPELALAMAERKLTDALAMYAEAWAKVDVQAKDLSSARMQEMVRGKASLRHLFLAPPKEAP